MKIINREEFLKMPSGTVYCKGKPWYWEQICVKRESLENDWYYLELDQVPANDSGEWVENQERMLETGGEMPIQIIEARDGCFDDKEIFLIYSQDDLKVLNEYL